MPNEPVISIQELARSWAAGSSQRRKPVSGAIRQALTPTPHSTRAASSAGKAGGQRERHAAGHRDQQESRGSPSWAVAVQPGAQRQLDGREAEEVAACQQAQVARVQRELLASAWATAWP